MSGRPSLGSPVRNVRPKAGMASSRFKEESRRDRRYGMDRRMVPGGHSPERRSGHDRRSGDDRRKFRLRGSRRVH